jgi:transcriptional regulator with XRE-family HTH domain
VSEPIKRKLEENTPARKIVDSLGITQTQLAGIVGCSKATICNTLRGRRTSNATRMDIFVALQPLVRRKLGRDLKLGELWPEDGEIAA